MSISVDHQEIVPGVFPIEIHVRITAHRSPEGRWVFDSCKYIECYIWYERGQGYHHEYICPRMMTVDCVQNTIGMAVLRRVESLESSRQRVVMLLNERESSAVCES